MTKTRITFEADPPALRDDISETSARSYQLNAIWEGRRDVEWRVGIEPLSKRSKTHPTRHDIKLTIVNAGERLDGSRIEIIRLAIDVETREGEDALEKAKRVLDLRIRADPLPRTPDTGDAFTHGSLHRIRGDVVIGPMPMRWPVGRRLTDYSHNLGSYGQGGIGLSGWQLNGGSWMILPLSGSDGWITLTMEEVAVSPDRTEFDIVIDQRIIGAHPDQKEEYPPWEHRYAGRETIEDLPDFAGERPMVTRFEATSTGFVLETGRGLRNWRFEMGDRLPRPVWAGSGRPRLLTKDESIVDSFVLAHDMYLEV